MIHMDTKHGMVIGKELKAKWFLKVPTSKNRNRGTIGFDSVQWHRFLESEDLGVCWINVSKKYYILVPREIIMKYDVQDAKCAGVKNAMRVLPLTEMIKDHNLTLHPFQ